MKKLAALMLVLSLGLFVVVGCGETKPPEKAQPAAGAKAADKDKKAPEAKPAEKPATPPAEKK